MTAVMDVLGIDLEIETLDPIVGRFDEEEEDAWEGDSEEEWEEGDDWEEEDDEWDDEDEDWEEDEEEWEEDAFEEAEE